MVQAEVLNDTSTRGTSFSTLPVHADWLLAPWSVDKVNGTVPATCTAASAMLAAYQDETNVMSVVIWNVMHLNSMLHALSLAGYTTYNATASEERQGHPYATHLPSWASIQVWAFGLDSITSKIGAVIVIVGAVIVLMGVLLDLKPTRSPTELLVEALAFSESKGRRERDAEIYRTGYDQRARRVAV
ncbi:uncharacterized protein BO97DRAFT_427796 [Aspergillus homomorphus CBS 101889]|uniref:Uncharacterized protein n=1 Tax=Aspergillus homomorphus (strain CBS 101889) TaxID=1450537 RepID=A0A395HNX0_ASPHC|nr:hypothetical protein BO97DRAFT_427796 [Aspergillus homomorphus CBS 101889]RAL09123.1 hypothetical protein BO97DRAFT_427796 [Aspergillus homomorphus CBS 101889]